MDPTNQKAPFCAIEKVENNFLNLFWVKHGVQGGGLQLGWSDNFVSFTSYTYRTWGLQYPVLIIRLNPSSDLRV